MTKQHQRGFTLIELIIFIVVISVGLAGILLVMNTVVKSSADPMVRKQAIAIAESLLEEIVLKDYANPVDGDVGLVRATFDDVSQYDGYTSVGINDALGVAVPSLSSYSIFPAVTVTDTTLGLLTMKVITVSVSGPHGTITLTGYRGAI